MALMAIMKDAIARVSIGPVHLIPEGFPCESVLANEEGVEVFIDQHGRFKIDGAVQAERPAASTDAEVNPFNGARLRRARMVFVLASAKVVVNIERIHLVLLIYTGLRLVVPGEFREFDIGDFEVACRRVLVERMRRQKSVGETYAHELHDFAPGHCGGCNEGAITHGGQLIEMADDGYDAALCQYESVGRFCEQVHQEQQRTYRRPYRCMFNGYSSRPLLPSSYGERSGADHSISGAEIAP